MTLLKIAFWSAVSLGSLLVLFILWGIADAIIDPPKLRTGKPPDDIPPPDDYGSIMEYEKRKKC